MSKYLSYLLILISCPSSTNWPVPGSLRPSPCPALRFAVGILASSAVFVTSSMTWSLPAATKEWRPEFRSGLESAASSVYMGTRGTMRRDRSKESIFQSLCSLVFLILQKWHTFSSGAFKFESPHPQTLFPYFVWLTRSLVSLRKWVVFRCPLQASFPWPPLPL